MYAARRRQKSVLWKFQLGKFCIGQQFQLLDNPLRQLPQGSFIRHQVALHEPQFVNFIINNPPVILRNVSITECEHSDKKDRGGPRHLALKSAKTPASH